MLLERELISARNKGKGRYNFDDVLKGQIEETQRIKDVIDEKNDEINRLNEQINLNRRNTE